eukprot:CAMPEP_0182918310 /NCGR_PEP_ID=MMETSP0105_2-20130417/2012_1 /TAXON_ID=81532 ORGANISM="Acanthoeca-like sp., Strain 10tr" /NCGR_SAMPLE_ID=MMETSP0105_2 /ASSEMBLY_ACC=CAM_ASM_000205 /LENGTH=744 /DNA_ID=CAMNT_0025055381 /DNA_START=99 /DNA_END=2330 /DNA_ORIENTATION=+
MSVPARTGTWPRAAQSSPHDHRDSLVGGGTGTLSGATSPLTPSSGSKSKHEYKAQRKQYDLEKRQRKTRALRDRLDQQLGESTVKGWIKIRSRLKIWHKYWGVIYPGKLMLFDDDSQSSWRGTIILANLHVQERPTKKTGFSWKCTTDFGQDIFARKGPGNSDYFHNLNILPTDYAILRVATEEEARAWMDEIGSQQVSVVDGPSHRMSIGSFPSKDDEGGAAAAGNLNFEDVHPLDLEAEGGIPETRWHEHGGKARQSLGMVVPDLSEGLECQRSTISDSALTEFWKRMQGVKAGDVATMASFPAGVMDSRSLLSKLADPFSVSSLLGEAAQASTPHDRILGVTKWFLAGLATRSSGIPILPAMGEVYRCAFNPSAAAMDANTFRNRTFVVCEQVAANPPTSALVATNREGGWCLYGSVSGEARLWGNSMSVKTTSVFRLILLSVREEPEQYIIKVPHVKVKGLLGGRTMFEFVGESSIDCPNTRSQIKLTFNSGQNVLDRHANAVRGLYSVSGASKGSISGVWSRLVVLNMNDGSPAQTILKNDADLRAHIAPKREVVRQSDLFPSESGRLWSKAVISLNAKDEEDAEAALNAVYSDTDKSATAKFFGHENSDDGLDIWSYKFLDLRPWSSNDMYTMEHEGKISTMGKKECGEFADVVRHMSAISGNASGTMQTPRSSTPNTRRKSTSLSMVSRHSTQGDDLDDPPAQTQIATLEARVRELENHHERFQRMYVPLIGILFAL